jgi:hypothetical protein
MDCHHNSPRYKDITARALNLCSAQFLTHFGAENCCANYVPSKVSDFGHPVEEKSSAKKIIFQGRYCR